MYVYLCSVPVFVKCIYIAVIKLIEITNEIISILIQPAIRVTMDTCPTCQIET
jgi:hypothetical protein